MLIHTDKCSTREASPSREWWCMKRVTAGQDALVLIPKTRHTIPLRLREHFRRGWKGMKALEEGLQNVIL